MIAVVDGASQAQQVALIKAHPDLAGRVAREGRLTAASAAEQAGAGLGTLSAAEIAHFDADNAAYRERFGFPFVICVRENTKESILAALARRRSHLSATSKSPRRWRRSRRSRGCVSKTPSPDARLRSSIG